MREQVVYHECNVAYSSKPCHSLLEGQGCARRHSFMPCKVIVARLSLVRRSLPAQRKLKPGMPSGSRARDHYTNQVCDMESDTTEVELFNSLTGSTRSYNSLFACSIVYVIFIY